MADYRNDLLLAVIEVLQTSLSSAHHSAAGERIWSVSRFRRIRWVDTGEIDSGEVLRQSGDITACVAGLGGVLCRTL